MASKTIYSKVTNKPQKLTNFTKPQKLTNSDHKFNTEIQITTSKTNGTKFKICKLSNRSSHNSNLHNFGGSLMRTSKNPFGATMSRSAYNSNTGTTITYGTHTIIRTHQNCNQFAYKYVSPCTNFSLFTQRPKRLLKLLLTEIRFVTIYF